MSVHEKRTKLVRCLCAVEGVSENCFLIENFIIIKNELRKAAQIHYFTINFMLILIFNSESSDGEADEIEME